MTSPNSPAKYDGGPAFPMPSVGTGDPRDGMSMGSQGMTLRDWFAGKAMQGLIVHLLEAPYMTNSEADKTVATAAYQLADAMLAARDIRNKESK